MVKRIYTTKMMELYLNEVEVLRKVSHARLISLLGHCTETSNCEKFLVYRYLRLEILHLCCKKKECIEKCINATQK